jgi:HAE1 family hydrophobic/amphiphilic exporter-1
VGKELVPDDDQGDFDVSIRLPRGTSYARTEEFVKPIEKEILALPDVRRVRQTVGAGTATFGLLMTPLEERTVSQQDLMRRVRALLRKYQGARTSVTGTTDISGAVARGPAAGGGNRLNILIQGPDIEQLQQYTVRLIESVRTIPGVVDVDSNFEPTQPELRIAVNRARAADRPGRQHRVAGDEPAHARWRRRGLGVQRRR